MHRTSQPFCSSWQKPLITYTILSTGLVWAGCWMYPSLRTGSSHLLVQGREPHNCSTSRGQAQSLIWDSGHLTQTGDLLEGNGCPIPFGSKRGSTLILVRQSPLFTLHRSNSSSALSQRGTSQMRHLVHVPLGQGGWSALGVSRLD